MYTEGADDYTMTYRISGLTFLLVRKFYFLLPWKVKSAGTS